MYYLFEESDSLNRPIEGLVFDTAKESFPIRPHWHYFAEMIYMLEGCAEVHSGEEKVLLMEGELFFFHPKAVHSIFAVNRAPLKYVVLKFDINQLRLTPNYAPKLRNIFKSAKRQGMHTCFREGACVQMDCKKVFLECVRELHEQAYGYDYILQTMLYRLLMEMVRQWLEEGFQIENDVFAGDNEYEIDSITEYIDLHLTENLRVSEIAKQCGMSYSCFAKKFNAVYGMSCKAYIEQLRIFKVEEFLLFTGFDLNYISQETGFCDCSHMIKSFKEYRGKTPAQFRKEKGISDN
ncbi:MAG: AraC family transcriptional regulator [Lachnospiraceae bacterium]|nr:AraC family transcriptional regulator [Lachnospiraceae bacterium]